jgi:two-component system, OmpR family, sensor kinase
MSLRNKLALVFFAITAAAFSVIYFIVVPQLQSNLEHRQLKDLRTSVKAARARLPFLIKRDVPAPDIDNRVRSIADATDARVTLFDFQESLTGPQGGGQELRFYAITDSAAELDYPANDGLVRRAVTQRHVVTGSTEFHGAKLGQIAVPLKDRGEPARVIVYSRSYEDIAETVSFIRNRVLVASAIALVLALIGGYLVAQALARRVRRVELGARQVAAGNYVEPLPVDSSDELGQLTRAFNDMQLKLRQVDVARKEFVATASHELRTPIFSLAGFVELLQDEELDEETRREFLDTMGEQVARLQKLSVDLLDLSRLDAGSVELESEPTDLSEIARSVVSEFTPALAQHATELRVRLPDDGLEALCDRERVAQIMRILLDNALRHTPEGTQVTVSADRQNGAAELTVADEGPGLPDGAATHVFERFYTGDAARGAGLGLAIARELAERMDGRLTLGDGPGGTRFTLQLPSDDGA